MSDGFCVQKGRSAAVGSSIASKHFVTGRNVIPAVADTTSLPGKKPLFKLPIWLFSLIAYAYRDEAFNAFFLHVNTFDHCTKT